MSSIIARSSSLLFITTIIITITYSIDPPQITPNNTTPNPPRLIIRPVITQTISSATSIQREYSMTLAGSLARSLGTKKPANKKMTLTRPDKSTASREEGDGFFSSSLMQAAQIYDDDEAEMDPCYDNNSGEAIRCQPEFSDVAFNVTLTATSLCGSPSTSLHCLIDVGDESYYNSIDNTSIESSFSWVNFNVQRRHQITSKTITHPPSLALSLSPPSSSSLLVKQCFTCNKNNPNTSYPPSHLTDLHNPISPTCWASAPRARAVNLTLDLGKKHELTYISVEFCSGSRQPDVAIFWKSTDHAKSWIPIKYFSTDCQATMLNPDALLTPDAPVRHHHRRDDRRRFHQQHLQRNRGEKMFKNKRGTTSVPATFSKVTPVYMGENFQPTCSDIVEIKGQPLKLAFRGSEGHTEGGSPDPDMNPSLSDWITFSDLKLTLYHDHHGIKGDLPQVLSEGHEFFAVSNINVGARCKCNGHASLCIPTEDDDDEDETDDAVGDGSSYDYSLEKETGISDLAKKHQKMKCACRHNTRGMECERCKPLYNDRPWTRATSKDTNECTACNCHGHARSCQFNEQLYKTSKEHRSGGVCVRCRHNTAGRFCHVCADGYYRTQGRMLADKRACTSCSCHPIGSTSGPCNRSTGQCPCKRGVAGRSCDRCLEGFQHGNSPAKPCIQIKKSLDISSEKDNLCRIYCKRSWSLTNDFAKQVCRENYIVMQMKIISKKFKVLYSNKNWMKARTWIRYDVEILNVFNKKPNLHGLAPESKLKETQKRYNQYRTFKKLPKNTYGYQNLVLPGSKMAAWTRVEDVKDCNCINLRSGFVYLVALPISRQSRSWQEDDSKKTIRHPTTHRIKVSIPKFRIAGHRDSSDLLRSSASRSRHRITLSWNQRKIEKMPLLTSRIDPKNSNDSIPRSFKVRMRREEMQNILKPIKKSNSQPIKLLTTPRMSLARPREFVMKKTVKKKVNAKGQSPYFENIKQSKTKKEMNNVRMSRRSRIRLAHDSLVLAWNAKETKDLFNKLDCF